MNTKRNTNSVALHIWIAENGDAQAREKICKEVSITNATLCKILRGHIPKFEIRYRIYKLTEVKLLDEDKFPVLSANAS